MTYSITQVAKLADISTRTLRYYDEINLLKPIVSRNQGVRQYNKSHLITLQTILLYREMSVPLKEIKRIIQASKFQQMQSLQFHQMHLQAKLSQIKQMISTVDKTIQYLIDDSPIAEIELFAGLQHAEQNEVKQALQDNLGELGDKIIKQADNAAQSLTKQQLAKNIKQTKQVFADFLLLIEQGLEPSSSAAQNWVGRYVNRVNKQIPDLSDQDIMQIIEMETTHAKLKPRMDKLHPELANYFLQAAKIYFTIR